MANPRNLKYPKNSTENFNRNHKWTFVSFVIQTRKNVIKINEIKERERNGF